MRRMKLVGLAIVAVLALGATMTASAFAASNNPEFKVEGLAVAAGGEELAASATTSQVLKAPNITIECSSLVAKSGSKLLPLGLNSETLVYSGCGVPGKSACVVKNVGGTGGTIETQPLNSRLEWASETAANNEEENKTDTLFEPETGEAGLFVELEVSGTCPFLTTGKHKVTGEVLVENENTTAEALSHSLTAPTTALKHYWRNEGGVAVEKTVRTFEVSPFGTSTYSGTSSVSLTSNKKWKVAK